MSAASRAPVAPNQAATFWFQRLAGRCATASGSAAVVLALLSDVPLGAAVGRGALVFVAIVALGRGVRRLANSRLWRSRADVRTTPPASPQESGTDSSTSAKGRAA